MAVRNLQLRLQRARRGLRDRVYARPAAFRRDGVRSAEEGAVLRVFCNPADWETAEGTPLEAVLARLPSEMAEGIRRGLGVILAATTGLSEARLDR